MGMMFTGGEDGQWVWDGQGQDPSAAYQSSSPSNNLDPSILAQLANGGSSQSGGTTYQSVGSYGQGSGDAGNYTPGGYISYNTAAGDGAGNTFQQYDNSGQYTSDQKFNKDAWMQDLLVAASMAVGIGAIGAGVAGAAGAAGAGVGDATAAGYAGLDAASAATMGGGASIAGGSALDAGAAGAAGAGSIGASASSSGAGGLNSFDDGSMSQILQNNPNTSGLGPYANTNPTFNPAQDSQLANQAIDSSGGNALSGYTGAPATNPTISNLGPDGTGSGTNTLPGQGTAPPPTGSTSGSGIPPIPSTGLPSSGTSGTSSGGVDPSSLLSLLSGLYGYNQQNNASNDMLTWLNGQQAKIDNLYTPNSPEYNALWDQMSRTDAAAGRNSQYGPRSVDLAAKITQIKADETQKMTTGIGGVYAAALNNRANAGTNLIPGLNSLFGANGSSSINWNQLANLFGGSSTGTTTGTTGTTGTSSSAYDGSTGFGTGSNYGNQDVGQFL